MDLWILLEAQSNILGMYNIQSLSSEMFHENEILVKEGFSPRIRIRSAKKRV